MVSGGHPNAPAQLTFTTPDDPDGDWVRFRAVIREQGTAGVSYTNRWSAFVDVGTVTQSSITVPADAPLQPNGAYEWTIEFQDRSPNFIGTTFTANPKAVSQPHAETEFEASAWVWGPSPMQPMGPVAVNLATGNLTTTISTPAVSTLGGSIGCFVHVQLPSKRCRAPCSRRQRHEQQHGC